MANRTPIGSHQGGSRNGGGKASRTSIPGHVRAAFADGPISARVAVLFAIFLAIALGFFIRLVYLQVIVANDYSQQATASRTVDIQISPKRGTIYDRNGNVLAKSIDATTVYCNPREITDVDGTAAQVAAILGGNASDYTSALSRSDTSFAYLKRKADVDVAQKLNDLNLKGIYFLGDTKRVYPNGATAGQIIGLVSIDGEGLTGLELYYNDILAGKAGHMTMEEGATGIVISGTEQKTAAVDGQDIVVSLDLDMQQYLEEEISSGATRMGGNSGQAILMDGSTGEIIACASTPLLNPSDTSTVEAGSTEAQCITSAYEPGSIFKAVTMMACLEAGVVSPTTEIDCPAYLQADEYTVSDAHERGDETLTVAQIMAQSSNVGVSLCASKLGFRPLYEKIGQYNLDEEYTGVDYPGEACGYLTDQSTWSTIQSYNVSFGQGVSVTPLQMVRFYGALTNNGVECTPHFLISKPQSNETPSWPTEQVIDNTSAIPTLTSLLEGVVNDGTGKAAQIDGYEVAGKTGTAEYADDSSQGYVSGSYNLSFVGYLPNSDSNLVCFVGVTKVPTDSTTTAIFKDIMQFAIGRYNINPTRG